MFEMVHLYEDALREYDELELCYLETGMNMMINLFSKKKLGREFQALFLFHTFVNMMNLNFAVWKWV